MPTNRDDYMDLGAGENLDYMDLRPVVGAEQANPLAGLPVENLDYMRGLVPTGQGGAPAAPTGQMFEDPLDVMLRGQKEALSNRAQAWMPGSPNELPVGFPGLPSDYDQSIEELEQIERESVRPKGLKPRPPTPDEPLEPMGDERVPPGQVYLKPKGRPGAATTQERVDVFAGRPVAEARALFGKQDLAKFLPWMDPNQPGLSIEEKFRRESMYGDLTPQTAVEVGATRESGKQRLKMFQAARQEELLGTPPAALEWEQTVKAKQTGEFLTTGASQEQIEAQAPPAPEVRRGLLHPVVASMAWGLNADGRNPDRTSKGIRRLTRLGVSKSEVPGDKALVGFDFDKFRSFTGKDVLPPDQSILLLGLAERAKNSMMLSMVMENPEVRKLFLLTTPAGFDASTPDAANAELELARSRAMAWMDEAVRKSPDLGNLLNIERDESGAIIPASFAEDPEYWRKWSKTANLGDVLTRAELASRDGDFALAGTLASAHFDREAIREASVSAAIGNIPLSAGRTAIGVFEFYFAAISYAANQIKWGLEYAGDKAAGGGHGAVLEWQRKQEAAKEGFVTGVGDFATMIQKTAAGSMKAFGVPTMTDREYKRWKLEVEHDPVGTALVVMGIADGCFRLGGAALNMHKARTDGALAAALEGAKKGSAAYKNIMRINTLLKGAGAISDVAGRVVRPLKAKKLRIANEEWLKENQATAPQVAERTAAINEAIKNLTTSETDVALRKVLEQELRELDAVAASRAALEAATSQLAGTPTFGPWLKRWLYPPSKIEMSKDMAAFSEVARNKGSRKAMEIERTFNENYERLVNGGVPEETARVWATSMQQGIGQFAESVAWDLSRPYGRVVEQALAATKTNAYTLKVGKVEYDMKALEAKAAQQGIEVDGVVHNIIANEMQAFKPKIVLPPNFDKLVADLAVRQKLTEGQAAYKLVTLEMERIANQGRAGKAAVAGEPLTGAVRLPELTVLEGGKRVFEWDGTRYEVRPSVVKGEAGFDAKYSVWGPKGEIAKTRAKKPDLSLRHFLDEQVLPTGETKRYYTQAVELPEITGVDPEAIRFALVTDWALGRIPGGKVGGLDAGHLIGFYNELIQKSPAIKNLPGGTWARHSVALETLRRLYPKMYLDPAIPKGSVIAYLDDAGKMTTRTMEDIFHGMGKKVENRARYAFETGLIVAEQGLIPLDTLGRMGLQYAARSVLPEVRRVADFKKALKAFASEKDIYTGVPLDVRKALVNEILNAKGKEPLAPIEGPTAGPQTRAELAPPEMDAVLGGVDVKKLAGGESFKQRVFMAGHKLPGLAGEALYKRVYETGAAADLASTAQTVMARNLGEMVGAMRAQAAFVGSVVTDLMNGKLLSAEATTFLKERTGRVAMTLDPAQRLSLVLDTLREVDAIVLPPELRTRLAPYLKQVGLAEPVLRGLTDAQRTAWKQGIVVSRTTQYALEHIAGPALTEGPAMKTMAAITSWIKGNKIVHQLGPWNRDIISNWAILGPVNGLMPHSRGWSIAFELAETENAIVGALRAAGQAGGPLTETTLGATGAAPRRGLKAQASQAYAKFRRDFNGELEGKTGGDKALRIGWLFLKLNADLAVNPGKTGYGRIAAHQRSMTDFAPRAAMLAQKLSKEVATNAEFLNHLSATAKKYGVRPVGKNPVLPWAAEESILGTTGRIAKAAWKKAYQETRARRNKNYAQEVANREMGKAYSEVFEKAFQLVDAERLSKIMDETVKAFVDYNDKPKIVDALSKVPFGPIFITWSTQVIPMVAGYFARNPVKAMAWRGLYEVFANTILAMMNADGGGSETLRQFEKSAPPWQLVLPFSTSEFTGAEGETLEMKGALDASFLQPFSVSVDMVNPITAPGTAPILQGAQLLQGDGTPHQMFPLKDHMTAGGPPMAEPSASKGEKILQWLASEWSNLEPATSPLIPLRAALGHAWGDSERGILETGPLPAGYTVPSTYGPLSEAIEGPRKPEQPVGGVAMGVARMFGMRIVPAGEKAAGYRLMAPEEETKRAQEAAEARGERPPAARSVVGYAKQQMKEPALAVLNDFEAHLEAREKKAARKGKANIAMGGESWRSVEQDRAALDAANSLYKTLSSRGVSILDTFRAGALHAYRASPSEQLWFKSEDIEYVCEVAKEDVADRMAEVIQWRLENKQQQKIAGRSSDVPYEVLEKAALEYVYEPLTLAMNAGFTPDAVKGGRMVTARQVGEAIEAEMQVPFSQYVRRYAAEDRTDAKANEFIRQGQQRPEAPIRVRARRSDKRKSNLLMGAEPLPEELE